MRELLYKREDSMINNPIIQLFGMGMPGPQELIIIFAIILFLFGAKKIPELARGIGKGMNEFKKAKEEDLSDSDEQA